MNQHVILTAIGADRPGIVDEVSEFIFERGGNIEDSRMVNLRGQFAMMVLIAGESSAIEGIRRGIDELTRQSRLRAELRPAESDQPTASAHALPFRLTASTMDQAGLVHRFAHLLREMHVNIESLDTHLVSAPVTGAPMFEMELIITVPREKSLIHLREKLGQLGDEFNIDWELTAM